MKRNSFSWGSAVLAFAALFLSSFSGRAGGTVTGWGGNSAGQISPCVSNIVAIAAGYIHSLYLLEDGTVADCGMFYGYGSPDSAITVPPGLSNVVAVSAGDSHSLALRADGTVAAWGLNYNGQTDIPAGLTNVAAIAAGGRYSLALKKDGSVVGWGGGGTNIPAGLSNVIAISAGAIGNNLALKADGTVIGWDFQTETASLNALTNIVAISSGPAGSFYGYESWLALKSNGDVISRSSSGVVSIVQSNAIAISCSRGTDHHISLALKSNGTVAGWGYNFYGGPNVPVGLSNVVAIAAGSGHQLALVGGGPPFIQNRLLDRVAVMGGKAFFRVEATGTRPLTYQWKLYGTNLPGANSMVLALSNLQPSQAGSYSVSVSNAFGGVTSESAQLTLIPLQITQQPASRTNIVGTTATFSVEVQALQPLYYQWRREGVNIDGATNSTLVLGNVQFAQAGAYSVVASNAYGTIVSSNAILTVVPILITAQPQDAITFVGGTTGFGVAAQGPPPLAYQWKLDDVDLVGETNSSLTLVNAQRSQAGRYSVTLSNPLGAIESRDARLSVVAIAAWGSLGQTNVPVDSTNVNAIAAGLHHQLRLDHDGLVTAWGDSDRTNIPAGLSNVVAISGGCYADGSLALRNDGTVVMWGINSYGHPPLQAVAANLTNIVATAGGQSHMLALRTDGTIVAWGSDFSGQSSIPSQATNSVAVAAGENHSLALKADGTVRAWGDNSDGQRNVPAGLVDVVAVAAGAYHSVALRADGTVVAWGGSTFAGQTNLPAGLSNVVAIAAGEYHTLALKADGTVIGWNYNFNGQTNIPIGLTNVVAIAASRSSMALIGDGPPIQHVLQVNPTWSSSGFTVDVPTQSGRVYRLEYKDTPYDLNWKALPLVAGNGDLRTLTDPTATGSQRFYRIRQW